MRETGINRASPERPAVQHQASPLRPEVAEISRLEGIASIHAETSDVRERHGIAPLARDRALDAIAQDHAEDMAERGYFEHRTPEGARPSDRASLAGYDCRKDFGEYYTIGIAENISMYPGWGMGRVATVAVRDWMDSPGHRENILMARHDRLGVGMATSMDGTIYAVQNFC